DKRSISSAAVYHAMNDDRAEACIAVGIGPRKLQTGHVRLVDLARREVTRVVGTVAIPGPPFAIRRLSPTAHKCSYTRCNEQSCCDAPQEMASIFGHIRTPSSVIDSRRYH